METEETIVPRISLIGGGTGSFTLLQELKHLTPNITALVNMSDNGGSSGKLRDELGVLPPGDVRQCLVALSNLPGVRDMFNFRFPDSSMRGDSLGNIILAGLELMNGGFDAAVTQASELLQITGKVIPITLQKHDLVMQDDTEFVRGEYEIGHRPITDPEARVRLDPPAPLHPDARTAMLECDLLTLAPGNLYGSLLPALSAIGIRQAFADSPAKKVVITNLVTKPGQTDDWHVVDYVKKIETYIGEGQVDAVLYNNQPPSPELLANYAKEGEFPVDTDPARFGEINAEAIGANLLNTQPYQLGPQDEAIIPRTLIRHDARQVGRQLMRLFYSD